MRQALHRGLAGEAQDRIGRIIIGRIIPEPGGIGVGELRNTRKARKVESGNSCWAREQS